MSKEKLLSVKEASEQTNIPERTLTYKIATGKLKAQRSVNEIGQLKYYVTQSELDLLTGKVIGLDGNTSNDIASHQQQEETLSPALASIKELADAQAEVRVLKERLSELKDDIIDERQQKEKWLGRAGFFEGKVEELDKQVKLLSSGNLADINTSKVAEEPIKDTSNVAKDDSEVGEAKKKPVQRHTGGSSNRLKHKKKKKGTNPMIKHEQAIKPEVKKEEPKKIKSIWERWFK